MNFFISRTIDPQDKLESEDIKISKNQASESSFLKVVKKELQNQKQIQASFAAT